MRNCADEIAKAGRFPAHCYEADDRVVGGVDRQHAACTTQRDIECGAVGGQGRALRERRSGQRDFRGDRITRGRDNRHRVVAEQVSDVRRRAIVAEGHRRRGLPDGDTPHDGLARDVHHREFVAARIDDVECLPVGVHGQTPQALANWNGRDDSTLHEIEYRDLARVVARDIERAAVRM